MALLMERREVKAKREIREKKTKLDCVVCAMLLFLLWKKRSNLKFSFKN
jgi:hypothetical protein